MAASPKRISAEEFLNSIVGNVVHTSTDGHDVYMEFEDGRVILFTAYAGNIVLGHVNARPQTLQ